MGPVSVLGSQSGDASSSANQLSAPSGSHFNIVYFHAGRDGGQGHGISDFWLDFWSGKDIGTELQPQGG